MTLGERLREQIDQQHKQVALTWFERWQATHPDFQKSPNSVVSQFSRCLNDKPGGVRFFFGSRDRADLLFEVLEVPVDERESLWAEAQGIMGAAVSSPAVVVDLTPWSGPNQSVVFNGLRNCLDVRPELGAISLVLTREQAEQIPNGLASMPGVKLEPVERPGDGWERTLDLVGEKTLVVSKVAYENLALWLALDVENRELMTHPADGFDTFARERVLPLPEPITHSVFAIGVGDGECQPKLPESSVARRRLIYELADESSPLCGQADAATRAALARALDVDAASTARERLEHELARLEAQLREAVEFGSTDAGDDDSLARELALRKQRAMPAKLMRVGDQLHLLIETGQAKQALPQSPRIEVHESAPKVVLREILADLETWGHEDYLRDPYFDRLLERLVPADETAIIYHHARAFLLATGHHPTVRAGERADWREAVTAVLASDPPAAELLVPVVLSNKDNAIFGRPTAWLGADNERRVVHDNTLTSWWRHLPPATRVLAIGRGDKLSTRRGYQFLEFPQSDPWGSRPEPTPPAEGLLSLRTRDGDLVSTWQALLDASGLLPDYRDDAIRDHERSTRSGYEQQLTQQSLGLVVNVTGSENIAVPVADWQRGDEYLASFWLALHLAMREPVSVSMHDRTTLLLLGGSVLARLTAETSPCRYPGPTRALLVGTVSTGQYREARGVRLAERTLYTHRADTNAYTTHLGLTMPLQARIYAGGYLLSIEFVASPLLAGGLTASVFGAITGSVAAQLERDDDERARDDDDD